MDEVGAVNKARGKLERRRQEAYRARAAATVKIQRWYRRCRDPRRGVRSPMDENSISHQQSTEEESFTESTSGTLSIASEQESRDTTVQDVVESPRFIPSSQSDHSGSSSTARQQEQSNSFDEFVNSEVAVAKAMMDNSYMDKLNYAQRKRVERLMAYRRVSGETVGVAQSQATLQEDASKALFYHPPLSIPESSNVTQAEPQESSVEPKANVKQMGGGGKSSIPIRTNKKQQHDLHIRDLKNENVRETKGTESNPQTSHHTKEHGQTEKDVRIQPHNVSKQRPTKPTCQKEQGKVKEQVVQLQTESKEPVQLKQPVMKDATRLHLNTNDLVKIGSTCQVETVNGVKLNDSSRELTTSSNTASSCCSSEPRETQANIEPKDEAQANLHAHMQGEEDMKMKMSSKLQQSGQKVLKFASKVMYASSTSPVQPNLHQLHKPSADAAIKQPLQLKQLQQDTAEPASLKRSSATTKLTLQREVRDEIETLMSDSASVLSQNKKSHGTKSERQSTMMQKQSMISATVQAEEDSGSLTSFNSSPEHSTPGHTNKHSQAPVQGMLPSTRHTTKGGGYSVAYAKRKVSNDNRIIKSLRSPRHKPTERKQHTGYLQKFLRSTEVQNFIEDLQNSEPDSSTSEMWHSAWSSMPGGLPNWSNPSSAMYSPPPRDWESVMESVARMNSLSSRSHDLPLHHHKNVHRRPHHLHPLVAPTRHKHLARKAGHCKSYSCHQPRTHAFRSRTQHLSLYSQQFSNHRRSQSHVIPGSWRRKEHYYDGNIGAYY